MPYSMMLYFLSQISIFTEERFLLLLYYNIIVTTIHVLYICFFTTVHVLYICWLICHVM